jgi:hypothetical protein
MKTIGKRLIHELKMERNADGIYQNFINTGRS